MKKILIGVVLLCSSISFAKGRDTAAFIEVLGRGGVLSINLDHQFGDVFGAGAGLSYFASSIAGSTFIIPLFLEGYLSTGDWRPFITAGYTLLTANNVFTMNSTSFNSYFADVGAGIEFRSSGGFLFRATPYLIMGSGAAFFWGGLTLGYAF